MMSYTSSYQQQQCCDEQQQQQQRLDTITAMNKNEKSGYVTNEYLNDSCMITPDDRYKMTEWCFTIVDFCKFQRSTVSICMSYVDRYLAASVADNNNNSGNLSNVDFQLLVLAALYSSVKIHENEAISPSAVAALSRGVYKSKQIEEMEFALLQKIYWRVNPPTSYEYSNRLMELISEVVDMPQDIQDAVTDLTKFQCELAVLYYDFVPVPASHLAVASLINAMESVCDSATTPSGFSMYQDTCLDMWSEAACVDIASKQFHDLRMRLYEAVYTKPATGQISRERLAPLVRMVQATAADDEHKIREQQEDSYSPRSVTRSSLTLAPKEAASFTSMLFSVISMDI